MTKELLQEFCSDWDAAITRNNADEIAPFMSEDWEIVGGNGATSKESFLSEIRSGDLTHSIMDSDEIIIKVYGNTGIVISRGTSAGTYKGRSFNLYEWSSSIILNVDGKLQCVNTMITPVMKT